MTSPYLATIGYERATLGDVIARLHAANVEIVLDVRAVAASRRAGFSKTVLAASLNEEGIECTFICADWARPSRAATQREPGASPKCGRYTKRT